MRMFLCMLVASAVLGSVSQSAFAGGGNNNGGSKKNGTVRVTNNTSETAAVIIDNDDPPTDSTSAFTNAGGRFLQPGQSASFTVKTGSHTVFAALIDENGDLLGDSDSLDVDVSKGSTRRVSLTSSNSEDVTISQTN